jgi:hypothetical protein
MLVSKPLISKPASIRITADKCSLRSNLTALDVYIDEARPDYSCEWDHDVAALVQALPQLRLLYLLNYALPATDAGMQCTAVCEGV